MTDEQGPGPVPAPADERADRGAHVRTDEDPREVTPTDAAPVDAAPASTEPSTAGTPTDTAEAPPEAPGTPIEEPAEPAEPIAATDLVDTPVDEPAGTAEPAVSDPTAGAPTTPEPITPEPITPEPIAPEPIAPERIAPEPIATTDAPAATEPAATGPEAGVSSPAPTPAPAPTPTAAAPTAIPAATPSTADPAADDTAGSETFPAVATASTDPGRWGRVDDEGTVWLRGAEGAEDRAVGSWQAGDAAEGLAHFARRFDDLRTEADLLVRRIRSGRGDARSVHRSATVLRERLDVASVVGDVPALVARVDAILAASERATADERSARAGAREQAVARKEALITEAETLAEETTRWKHAGDRFSAMLDEWKAIRGIDRKTDDALWKRFAKAREAFTRRRGAHFAEMDRARTAARTRKEELVAEAESLVESTDWGATAGRYKELMADWKAAGRTTKDADDALWARFRGAQDTFFSRRSATFDARDAEFTENARAKEALLAQAARIDLSDVDAARVALRDLQERWDQIGKVPRERVREFATRLKEVEDRVRGAVDRRWQQTDPETEARVGQFRERVSAFEAQAEKARAAGDRRRAEEAERQAAQWREWLSAAERATR